MEYEDLRRMVGRRVQQLRERREWNQRHLQDRSGLSHKSISNIESTDSGIQLDTISAVASAFGMEAWELIKPGLEDTYRTNDVKSIYDVDPRNMIRRDGPHGLRDLATDEVLAATLGITPAEWRVLAAIGSVLPVTVDKAGYVQLLFTLRGICR